MVSVNWLARQIGEIWMEEPVHPQGLGYTKLTQEVIDNILDDGTTVRDVMIALEEQAKSRGYDYVFKIVPDYNIDTDTTDHIIEWRNSPTKVGEGE